MALPPSDEPSMMRRTVGSLRSRRFNLLGSACLRCSLGQPWLAEFSRLSSVLQRNTLVFRRILAIPGGFVVPQFYAFTRHVSAPQNPDPPIQESSTKKENVHAQPGP